MTELGFVGVRVVPWVLLDFPELVEYMRGRGRTRIMFGTNWPMTKGLYLAGNARRVFKLILPVA